MWSLIGESVHHVAICLRTSSLPSYFPRNQHPVVWVTLAILSSAFIFFFSSRSVSAIKLFFFLSMSTCSALRTLQIMPSPRAFPLLYIISIEGHMATWLGNVCTLFRGCNQWSPIDFWHHIHFLIIFQGLVHLHLLLALKLSILSMSVLCMIKS